MTNTLIDSSYEFADPQRGQFEVPRPIEAHDEKVLRDIAFCAEVSREAFARSDALRGESAHVEEVRSALAEFDSENYLERRWNTAAWYDLHSVDLAVVHHLDGGINPMLARYERALLRTAIVDLLGKRFRQKALRSVIPLTEDDAATYANTHVTTLSDEFAELGYYSLQRNAPLAYARTANGRYIRVGERTYTSAHLPRLDDENRAIITTMAHGLPRKFVEAYGYTDEGVATIYQSARRLMNDFGNTTLLNGHEALQPVYSSWYKKYIEPEDVPEEIMAQLQRGTPDSEQ